MADNKGLDRGERQGIKRQRAVYFLNGIDFIYWISTEKGKKKKPKKEKRMHFRIR